MSSSPARAEPVTVAFVGDARCGKTSLVTAAATETFSRSPPPCLPPTRLPADATLEGNAPLTLVDTSSREEDRAATDAALRSADVVVLCFDPSREGSVERLGTHWVPLFSRLGISSTPVVAVACKTDLCPPRLPPHAVAERVELALSSCSPRTPGFEAYVLDCCARRLHGVSEVIRHAVKAVLFPRGPLLSSSTTSSGPSPDADVVVDPTLSRLCNKALRRIFLACDADGDGALSDAELNAFQLRCFWDPLSPGQLAELKALVASRVDGGVVALPSAPSSSSPPRPGGGGRFLAANGGSANGNEAGGRGSGGGTGDAGPSTALTLSGFLSLHALIVERRRPETVWAVLRTFGYSDDLRLSPQALAGADVLLLQRQGPKGASADGGDGAPSSSPADDATVAACLSARAASFFRDAFSRADGDGDGELSRSEERDLWLPTAPESPWALPDEGDGEARERRRLRSAGGGGEESPPSPSPLPPSTVPRSVLSPEPTRESLARVLAPRGVGGGLTSSGFLAKCHFLASVSPTAAAASALYLGFDGPSSDLAFASRPRKAERKSLAEERERRRKEERDKAAAAASDASPPSPTATAAPPAAAAPQLGPLRPLLRGLVFGPSRSGKSTLVAGLAGAEVPSSVPPTAANSEGGEAKSGDDLEAVAEVHLPSPSDPRGSEESSGSVFLSLKEVGAATEASLLSLPPRAAASALAAFDVAAFVYDAADESGASFDEAVAKLISVADAAGPELPCVLVAANDGGGGGGDGGEPSSSLSEAVAAACGSLSLRLPLPFSPAAVPADAAAAYSLLASIARAGGAGDGEESDPGVGGGGVVPMTPLLRARRARQRAMRRALLGAAAGTGAALAVWAVWKATSASSRGKESAGGGEAK